MEKDQQRLLTLDDVKILWTVIDKGWLFSIVLFICICIIVARMDNSNSIKQSTYNEMSIHEMLDNGGEIVGTSNDAQIMVVQMPEKMLYRCWPAKDECELID